MEIRLFDKQQEAFDDITSKIVLIIAGKRGAKTTTGALKLLSNIQSNMDKGIRDNYLVVGPTYGVLKRATIPTLLKYLDPKLGVYRKSDSCVELCDGNKIYIISADEENRIEGFQALDCWFDEAGMCSRTSFEKIWQRTTPIAGKDRGQIIITTTPYSVPSSWLNADLISQRDDLEYVGYYNWGTKDNPYMSAKDVEDAKAIMDPQIFQRDYLGLYVQVAGAIYKDFDRTIDTVKPYPIDPTWKRYGGLDYGYSDPTAIVIIAKNPDAEEYVLTDSFYQSKSDYHDWAEFFKKQVNLQSVMYDPSAVGMMELLRKEGRFNLQAADNSVEPGIARVTTIIKTHKLKVFNTEEEIINDLESYVYADKGDKPKHENSHGPDAIRYCCSGAMLYRGKLKQSLEDREDKLERLRKEFLAKPWDDKFWSKSADKNRDNAPSNKNTGIGSYGLSLPNRED